MRVLLDTNVVLDVLLDRSPGNEPAERLWNLQARGEIEAHFISSAITDVFYVARRHAGRDLAWQAVDACIDQLHIVAVGAQELRNALAFGGTDFEDDLQIACAVATNLELIITRDPSGFRLSPIEVVQPSEALRRLGGGEPN